VNLPKQCQSWQGSFLRLVGGLKEFKSALCRGKSRIGLTRLEEIGSLREEVGGAQDCLGFVGFASGDVCAVED